MQMAEKSILWCIEYMESIQQLDLDPTLNMLLVYEQYIMGKPGTLLCNELFKSWNLLSDFPGCTLCITHSGVFQRKFYEKNLD